MEVELTEKLVVNSDNGSVTIVNDPRYGQLRITIKDGPENMEFYITPFGLARIVTVNRDNLIDLIEEF